jgi:hypothetical protein
MRWSRSWLLAAGALVLGACTPKRTVKTEQNLEKAVAAALTRGDTATIRMFIEVPFAFSRLYIAGPGTPEPVIAAALQSAAWLPEFSRQIESAEHFHLLVFETRGTLVPAVLPKSVADIAPELTGRIYGPNDAVFSVRRPADAAAPILAALPSPPASEASARE